MAKNDTQDLDTAEAGDAPLIDMSWAVADDPSNAAAAIANLRIYTSPFRAGWHCLLRKGRIGLPA